MANFKVALLRGINVGGKNPIKMAELRALMHDAGFESIQTYIQSGNICFEKAGTKNELASELSELIAEQYGYQVPVMVRDQNYLRKLIDNNPIPDADLAKLHITLLDKKPAAASVSAISNLDFGSDSFAVAKDAIYVHCPSGYGKTKLTNTFFENKLNVKATTRNWKTVNKLVVM